MELPQLLLCLPSSLLRMGRQGKRKGRRKKEEATGKNFADLAIAAALGPRLWCRACGPVAGVLLRLLWLLGGIGWRAWKNMWSVSQRVLCLGWLEPLRPSGRGVQESSGNGAKPDDALVEV